jgi:hypothetical protein
VLQPSGRLPVESDGNWKDTNEALTTVGARTGRAVNLALIDDGSKVYVGDSSAPFIGGRPFFGEVQDGKPRFTPAPQGCEYTDPPRNIVDRDGIP